MRYLQQTQVDYDHGDNKFRATNVNSPLSIQTTNAAYLAIQADCYTKSEVNGSLAWKRNVINNVPGTGERPFEVKFIKCIFAVEPFRIKAYLNLNDPDDPNNASIELNIDENPTFT